VAILIKAEQTFFFDQPLNRGCVGRIDLDRDTVMLAHTLDEFVSLGMQPARI
jgi:hypothetical protein